MSDPLVWHRLQFAFTIIYHYIFPQLTMGLALLIVVLKIGALRTGRTEWDDAARFWIRIFAVNFAVGVVTGVPDGVSVRHQLGPLLEIRRRRDRTDARDGGPVRVLPRVDVRRAARLRRAAPRDVAAHFLGRGRAVRRHLALGLLHRLHERVHAAPGRPRHRRRTARSISRTSGRSPEPVGHRAVRAHDDCLGRDGVVRRAGGRRVLRALRAHRDARTDHFCASASIAGLVVERARRVPDRRPSGEARRRASADRARGDGGPLRHRARRSASSSSASPTCESGGSTTRSSSRAC